MSRKKLGLATLFFCLVMCLIAPMVVYSEEGIDYLSIGAVDIYKDGELQTGYRLPVGVFYDSSSNTITLENCNLGEGIRYSGRKDISIAAQGNNKVPWVAFGYDSGGDLYIKGTGTITALSSDGFTITQESTEKSGDLHIEGVTFTNVGIAWRGGSVFIKEAKMNVTGYYDGVGNTRYGITTGTDGFIVWENNFLAGDVSIENSDIEIRGCEVALLGKELHMSGVKVYGGDSMASYQISSSNMFRRRYYFQYDEVPFYDMAGYGYLHITPENLNLPVKDRLYGMDGEIFGEDGRNICTTLDPKFAKDYVELSKHYAHAGDRVDVKVTLSGYVVDYILLGRRRSIIGTEEMSDEPIYDDGFTMPKEDVVIRIYLKKGNAGSSTSTSDGTGGSAPDTGTVGFSRELSKGTVIKNVSGGNYKVTGNGTVEYTKPVGKKKTVKIPDAVTKNGVSYLVTSIAANAFKNNKKVTKVIVGGNVQKIGANAFYGCRKLKSVSMKNELISIGAKAFYKCTALTGINLPYSLKSIGKQAFCGCSKLKRINVRMQEITKRKIGSKAFSGVNRKATVNIYNTTLYLNRSKAASVKKVFKAKGMPATAKYKIKADF